MHIYIIRILIHTSALSPLVDTQNIYRKYRHNTMCVKRNWHYCWNVYIHHSDIFSLHMSGLCWNFCTRFSGFLLSLYHAVHVCFCVACLCFCYNIILFSSFSIGLDSVCVCVLSVLCLCQSVLFPHICMLSWYCNPHDGDCSHSSSVQNCKCWSTSASRNLGHAFTWNKTENMHFMHASVIARGEGEGD